MVLIPAALLTYYIMKWNTPERLWRNIWIVMILKLLKNIIVFIIMPTSVWAVVIIMFLANTISTSGMIFETTRVASFPVTAISGMFLTMLNSARNLGGNSTLHLKIIGSVGW
jgi:hypothetical protein